ncbi:MAG: ABC transporter permease [Fusobacteriaceae bacterium]
MINYILKRIFAGFLSLFILITITFFLMHSIPGGPFSPAEERKVPPSLLIKIEEKYGLNKPLHIQYMNYLKNLSKLDLGFSFKQEDTSVNEIISRGFPVSAKVGFFAIIASLSLGIPLGIISALKRGTYIDSLAMILATVGIAVPSFILTVLLMFFFCIHLKWLPTYGLSTYKHYILPVLGLSITPIAYMSRLMRSSLLEVLRQDYIRTARAKGVKEIFVILKHALRNSLLPIVTYIAPLIAGLLTGSFVIERLFSIPGIGRDFVTGIGDRDYSIILGLTIFFGAIIIVSNLVVDILYAIVDPRIKIDE